MNNSDAVLNNTKAYPTWLPYVAPMMTFMVFTIAEGYAPQAYYVYLYFLKAIAVTVTLIVFKSTWGDIKPSFGVLPLAVLIGVVVFAQWVYLDKVIPYPHLGTRTGFDPFSSIGDSSLRLLFMIVRLYGLIIMVPIMEEIFWRSFLLRYFTDADFTKIPLGTFTWSAFLIVAAAFGISHPEWLVAVITACAYALLLRQTKSLFACIVAHAVTNLALGIYVITTGEWIYW